ncbi:similar to Saccharomyces cerevisiae YHR079C-A SAE3 Meiosis specific protein involved in DMC1- dependent meiotic recombination, forms heterodimer with Mei5p [Maudiozyma barnettii]|uniref:Similar to Saccharomyces cerevisiae YHR079C-A SAE3 Meiosis specific protein involved in DMC1- dependent meiotic recombination, forms heterodimer with Mei5p n=1 Tax=Maudiozyma barnettii TaxID=61262 RepID=A0A8H2VBR0_9SACH|nr:Sae3p [Kazachstania barnettii]CAB4252343.1 similar to Saccharomyces cerevisiae YHR079C-A SAE3 Meiosis specific protein involved in DMC1- dependent meiotic recombination, forms heterodimer with Mei5p [Kazachstania barnettii]CAD1779077.1 similar to Saccharomyces cerevisiae YHR079C-A SAE3 Meiosis specific protein involved in DMC1- dependent meiotic recombination, forms heterodimer with Mei5p [Kazachstania barnettii]
MILTILQSPKTCMSSISSICNPIHPHRKTQYTNNLIKYYLRKQEANEVKKLHIQRLKNYNDLRDIGLRLTQLIADDKKCKMGEVFEEMGFSMLDE